MAASRTVAIAFVVALFSICAPAQTPSQTDATPENSGPPKTGAITGQVVDENGQPIKDVTVQLRSRTSPETKTVNTDREGQFEINGLEPVNYSIYAWMPSYIPGDRRPDGPHRVGDRVTLTLIKGGVVTGKVLNANGDPVVMVPVRAQMVRDAEGRPGSGWVEARSTDDRGIYRIYGLQAGTYVVYAGGPGRRVTPGPETGFGFDVPTYAPSSTRESATEISVRLGEEVSDVDIRYRGEQGRIISGDVTVPVSAQSGFTVSLISTGKADQQAEMFLGPENKRSFIFKGIADGEYSVIARSFTPEGELAISDSKQVNVQAADVTGIQLTTKMLGAVTGRVMLAETKFADCNGKEQPLATETLVHALPRNDEAARQITQFMRPRFEPARPDDKGNFRLRNLAPGAYSFVPTLTARQWYVQSITFGSPADAKAKQVDATRAWTNVKLGDRLSGLTVTMAQGGATLRGELVLAQGERAPAGSVLYLAPVEREKALDVLRFFATPIASNGYLELNNIAPGRYWVLAKTSGAGSTKWRLPLESETRAQIRREAEAGKTEIEFKPCQEVVDFKLTLKPQN